MSAGEHSDRYTASLAAYYNVEAAPSYDELNARYGYTKHNDRLKQALEQRRERGSGKIASLLDLGAGTGETLLTVKEVANPPRIVAVDFARGMLDKLEQKVEGIETVEADIRDYVEEGGESFDLVTAGSVLEFIPELPVFLRQTAPLINPGGALAFTYVPRGPHDPAYKDIPWKDDEILRQYAWYPEQISRTMDSAGLIIEEHDEFEAYKQDDLPIVYDFVLAGRV